MNANGVGNVVVADKQRAHANERPERMPGGVRSEWAYRRALAFGQALNRKGMPTSWGTGTPRTDAAWKRDQERRASRKP